MRGTFFFGAGLMIRAIAYFGALLFSETITC